MSDQEPLVPVADFALTEDPQYARQRLPGSLTRCWVRRGVAERLVWAQEHLLPTVRLCVWDGWRPVTVQQALFDRYARQLRAQDSAASEAEIARRTEAFVASPHAPFPHGTGGAVDLTLVDPGTGNAVDMGTLFDAFGPECALSYYETPHRPLSPQEQGCADRRRLLADALSAVGFVPYPGEWWHWEYGTPRWSRATGQQTRYAPIGGASPF